MTLEDYKCKGHPFARYNSVEDDIYLIILDWLTAQGIEDYENGGEFDPEAPLDYLMYDDHGGELRVRLTGQLVEPENDWTGQVLRIDSLEIIKDR